MLRCVIADYAHTVPVDHTPADYFPVSFFFFFNDTATTEIYTLSLHDALPISRFAAVHVRATEGLGVDVLAGRGLHQGRSAERSEEHTSELQSQSNLVCRLLLEKKKHRRLLAYESEVTPASACARSLILSSSVL